MTKVMQRVMAATLVCSLTTVFFSCGSDDSEEIVLPPQTNIPHMVIATEELKSSNGYDYSSRKEYAYDSFGRVVEEKSINGDVTYTYTFKYETGYIERFMTSTSGKTEKTTYYLNSQGLIDRAITYENGIMIENDITYIYDNQGYMTAIKDTEDNRTRSTFDWNNGDITRVSTASGTPVTIVYGNELSNGYSTTPNELIGTTIWVSDPLWRQGYFGKVCKHLKTQQTGGLFFNTLLTYTYTYTFMQGYVTTVTTNYNMNIEGVDSDELSATTTITWKTLP